MPIVAHAGEEILYLALVAWLVYLAVQMRKGRKAEPPEAGTCAYCGAATPVGATRCPECGFRTRTTARGGPRSGPG